MQLLSVVVQVLFVWRLCIIFLNVIIIIVLKSEKPTVYSICRSTSVYQIVTVTLLLQSLQKNKKKKISLNNKRLLDHKSFEFSYFTAVILLFFIALLVLVCFFLFFPFFVYVSSSFYQNTFKVIVRLFYRLVLANYVCKILMAIVRYVYCLCVQADGVIQLC